MRTFLLIVVALACVAFAGAEPAPPLRVGILADGESELWTGIQAAVKEKAAEQNVAIDFRIPEPATVERQNELALEMLDGGVQALAISPIAPEEQLDVLNKLAEKTPLITMLRDAPESKRVAFIGRDEEAAGRMLAQGVLRHLPGGVKVMAFGKEIEAPDTQRRITGLKETLGDTMTILEAVKEDKGDRMVAWANMEEIIQKRPEIAALIGLEPYHIPAMARAVTEGGRARMVRVIGMGPAPDMEELLKKGIAHAIIVDDARGYGAVALQTLVALAQGEKEELPEDGNIVVAPLALETESVMSVKEMMNELQVQAPWISETTPGVP